MEFFFLCTNLHSKKIEIRSDASEIGRERLTSKDFDIQNIELIGLQSLWEYFVSCPNPDLNDRFTILMVNLYTRFNEELS